MVFLEEVRELYLRYVGPGCYAVFADVFDPGVLWGAREATDRIRNAVGARLRRTYKVEVSFTVVEKVEQGGKAPAFVFRILQRGYSPGWPNNRYIRA